MTNQPRRFQSFEDTIKETLKKCPTEIQNRVNNRESEYTEIITVTDYEKLYDIILEELIMMLKGNLKVS